ncbi:MAG: GIDE domain-containing protein [Phycisphaerales bacterium]
MLAIIVNLILVGVGVLGLVLPVCGWKMFRRRADIRRTPVRTVSMLDRGWTALEGRAVPSTDLVGPFSARPCVYVEAIVEELEIFQVGRRQTHSNRAPAWTQVDSVTTSQPFYVEDSTGRVLVSAIEDDVHLDVRESFTFQNVDEKSGAFTQPLLPHIVDSLQRLGIDPLNEDGQPRRLRYIERAIEVGEDVFVTGNHSHHGEDLTRSMPGEPVQGVRSVITSEGGKRAYVSQGTASAISGRLLWQALACMAGGPALTVVCFGCLYLIYGIDWG